MDNLYKESIILVQNFDKKLNNHQILELYGMYKQIKYGNNNQLEPPIFFIQENYKWSYWNKYKNIDKESLKKSFVTKIYSLIKNNM